MEEQPLANAEQAEHWNAPEQAGHWVDEQARYDSMLAPFAEMLMGAAELGEGSSVLDVGCGCGTTTMMAARSVNPGRVVGVDISVPMVDQATLVAKAQGITNASFVLGDAQTDEFDDEPFDIVISRFGVMFFADPTAAFTNLRRASIPGGRLAFVSWRSMVENEWLLVPGAAVYQHVPPPETVPDGAPGMLALADDARVSSILDAAGWSDVSISTETTQLYLGGGGTVDDAVEFLRNGTLGRAALKDASPEVEEKALTALREALTPYVTPGGVRFDATVNLVTATA